MMGGSSLNNINLINKTSNFYKVILAINRIALTQAQFLQLEIQMLKLCWKICKNYNNLYKLQLKDNKYLHVLKEASVIFNNQT